MKLREIFNTLQPIRNRKQIAYVTNRSYRLEDELNELHHDLYEEIHRLYDELAIIRKDLDGLKK